MKKNVLTLLVILFLTGMNPYLRAALVFDTIPLTDTTQSKKEIKKVQRREARKNMKSYFLLSAGMTYAFLETQMRFIPNGGLISFQVGLEKNLGMQNKHIIASTSLIYRITPRSGFYGMYYGLNRNVKNVLGHDIYLPEDTIHAGAYVSVYFNTNVYSFGYLFSILTQPKSFLGFYFNVYLMDIKTGINSDIIRSRSYGSRFLAPLPNIGLIMDFELTKWFRLMGGMGAFFINSIDGVGGSFHNFELYTTFVPVKWLGASIGYQIFNVDVTSNEGKYLLNASYSYKGPSFKLTFRF